jgi:hypothetical protein
MRFQTPIKFPVFIEGKPATASVLEEIDHPIQSIFRVAFSDGFEDEFLVEEDGNVYGSGIAAIPYQKAIRFDISPAASVNPDRFYYSYPEQIDGMKTNVWVIEGDDENEQPIYKVYYFDFFRFALQKQNDLWIVSHKPEFGKQPDGMLVEKIGFLLNSLLEESR